MKTILSNSKVNALLEFASQKMLDSPRHAIEFDTDWPLFAPADPGIYCIFHGDKLLYAGETGNIRKRMKDLRRTMNHSFRRSLGKQLFSGHAGFVAAHNKAKFPVKFEQELNNYMATKGASDQSVVAA